MNVMSSYRRRLMAGAYPKGMPNYLCFTALESGTFTFTIGANITLANYSYIEYSTDECHTWTRTDNVASTEVVVTTPTISVGDKVYWRGYGDVITSTYTAGNYSRFSSTGKFNVSGTTNSLFRPDSFDNYTLSGGTYKLHGLFNDCLVVDASELIITNNNNVGYCYDSLFRNCSELTGLPDLSRLTVYQQTFYNAFNNCPKIETPPSLPATTVYSKSYRGMFYGCTSLKTAPALPATTLGDECYYEMFRGCTSLTTPPDLLATTVKSSCYQNMFYGCTSLTRTPTSLPATTLQQNCYRGMFRDCSALTTAMATLSATTIAGNSCYQMFYGCTSLETAPNLPATTLNTQCYYQMFYGCTLLKNVPTTLPATTMYSLCYYGMFQGCSSLKTAPVLPALTLTSNCYQEIFRRTAVTWIKMLATDISAGGCISNWVTSVPNVSTSVFVKHIDAQWTTTGNSGVPTNWKIIYYDPALDKYYLDQQRSQECDDHGNPI